MPPTHLRDYFCNVVLDNSHSDCCHTLANLCIDCNTSSINISYYHSLAFQVSTSIPEPSFFNQDKGVSVWEEAMNKELEALEANHSWDIVKLAKGKRPISCRWVYKTKHHVDGSIERYKAPIVTKGFTQKYGVDYHETFSLVVKFNTVRILVTLAIKK